MMPSADRPALVDPDRNVIVDALIALHTDPKQLILVVENQLGKTARFFAILMTIEIFIRFYLLIVSG